MRNNLKITFENNNKLARFNLFDQVELGPFTYAEKFIAQIAELYNGKIISRQEALFHLNNFLLKGKLKSKTRGELTLYFLINTLFPDVEIKAEKPASLLKGSIHLGFFGNNSKYAFVYITKKKEKILLSNFFVFEYQTLNFLNFLVKNNFVHLEREKELKDVIEDSFLYKGQKKTISN